MANVFSDEHRIASAGSRNARDNSIIKVQVASRIYRRKYTALSCLSEFQAHRTMEGIHYKWKVSDPIRTRHVPTYIDNFIRNNLAMQIQFDH